MRGVNCFGGTDEIMKEINNVFVPLRGVDCFIQQWRRILAALRVFVPLRGVDCFPGVVSTWT